MSFAELIKSQELNGQLDVLSMKLIPRSVGYPATQETIERMGIKITGTLNDLFFTCEFPEGWKIVPSDGPMWTYLIDKSGNQRASIFYKAAFYDTDAFIKVNSRYGIDMYHQFDPGTYSTVITDKGECSEIVHTRSVDDVEGYSVGFRMACDRLDQMYLDWRDPSAYWE